VCAEGKGHDSSAEISGAEKSWRKPSNRSHDSASKERLQMLYLLKSGQVASRQGLAELIGRDQATITWLRKYKDA